MKQDPRVRTKLIDVHHWRDQVNVIFNSDKLRVLLCFKVFLGDQARFIVKQSVRVPAPSDSSHKYSDYKKYIKFYWCSPNKETEGFGLRETGIGPRSVSVTDVMSRTGEPSYELSFILLF
jgi:hypothetical protein